MTLALALATALAVLAAGCAHDVSHSRGAFPDEPGYQLQAQPSRNWFERTVARRAEVELGCPADALATARLGGGAIRASGCGRAATYHCWLNPPPVPWVECVRETGVEASGY